MTAARELADLAERVLGAELPIGLRAWDGSEAGPQDGPVLVIADRAALRRLLWRPGELGLAQAYVLGEIDVIGDLADGLSRVWALSRQRPGAARRLPWLAAIRLALRHGTLGPPPAPPRIQATLDGPLHDRARDRAAISYHYDLSNDFYQLILDPSMAYSCALWTHPEDTLADAQRAKLDLICTKLQLRPGMRLLDVGCGWGSLTCHAAEHYGVQVTGVTLAAEQRAFVAQRIADAGLEDRAEVLLRDYREIDRGGYDAIACVEMGEHVGAQGYPRFARQLHDLLGPGGRLLVQQMSRSGGTPGGGPFIESYVAPDMHMRPVGATVSLLEQAGLELREVEGMREHYVRTARAWLSTLEERWDEAVALIGLPTARVWRLYLAGGALAFAERRMGVDQILVMRP